MKTRTLNEYLKKLPTQRQRKIEARAQEILSEELTLREIRNVLKCSQEVLAGILGVKQAEVSKMERRTDMYLSTVRRYVEAMGGKLDLIASFPGLAPVRISELSSLLEECDPGDAVRNTSKVKKSMRSRKIR